MAIASAATSFLFGARASADGPYVERGLVLPAHEWAIDLGLGVAHYGADGQSLTGAGVNFEVAYGITPRLEFGVRTGLRPGDDARALAPDQVGGRLYDTETYETGGSTLANPELRLRYSLLGRGSVELGLEGRAILPFADGTHFAAVFGLPVEFHIGNAVRLDTGVFIPVVFADRTESVVSIPARLWFQTSDQFWVGPIVGVRFNDRYAGDDTQVLLGAGLGYQISSAVDFKAEFLFPHINGDHGADLFGIGGGFQFRID